MSSAHGDEPAYSNSNYGRSNDETLYLAHSRNPHRLSFGAASGYGQRSCDTVALPQIPSASTQSSASLYPGQTQSTYQSSPVATLGYFPPLNLSVNLPQMPFSQPVPLQIMVQPSVGAGNVPQLNISINLPQIPSAVHPSFPTWPGQLQTEYQRLSEPALWDVLQSHDRNRLGQIQSGPGFGYASTLACHGQTQPRSFDTSFGNGQHLYDSGVLTQVLHSAQEPQHTSQMLEGGLVSTRNICASSSMGPEQSHSTQLLSFKSAFESPTLSSRPGSTNDTDYLSPSDSGQRLSPVYPGQHGSTYQPEQMYDHNISYQELRAEIENLPAPQELNNDIGPASEVNPFYPTTYTEEPQSTYLSSFQPEPAFDYTPDSSGSQVSSSALGSVNQDSSFCANYLGSHICELFNPLVMSDFQQKASPRNSDLNPSLKRTADEINPSGSELHSSDQSETAPSFGDAPGPRKRLREDYIGSTSCAPVQSLVATADYHDSHRPETFPIEGCRIFHDQPMGIPVHRSMSNETRNDISMFRGAHDFSIGGYPTFTNIGVNHVNNHSGAHDLEILTKFVSFDALHDSSIQDPARRCHPGTRANVLARLQAWTDDPSASENIVWLHGLPGAGKSSVAQTITRKCGREKVVATFFFYRSDPSRNDGNRLFTTIAWQLASSILGVKTYLANSLTQRPDLPMKDVETQFEELIVQPFNALNDSAYQLNLQPAPVVVIDGVDECTDENIQQRFLNVIGNAIRDRRVPLRFLILSRPEAHIKEKVDQFECPTMCIDLDSIDNANHDIERYFNAEFSSIADERDFDPTWPGDRVIKKLVCNSSGQFVYAATVMKYVGDKFNCAKSQLDVILGLRKRASSSPFAPLDDLYTEILKRQPDQDFLKDILALVVACSSIGHCKDLHTDFPTLLNVSKEEMGRKLRGMQSLLSFEDRCIDFHHLSFLDFLQDMSRSGHYHISEQASMGRYLGLIIATIVQYVSDVIDRPHCHDTQHLNLRVKYIFYNRNYWEMHFESVVEDLEEALQPLLELQDKLLNLPCSNRVSSCDQCDVFLIMRNILLQLAFSQAKACCIVSSTRITGPLMLGLEEDYSTFSVLPKIDAENDVSYKDLDSNLASLLTHIRDMPSTSSPTVSVLHLMHSLLHFDCVEIAKKVCSVSDAQHLMDLLDYMIQSSVNNGDMDLTCKAYHLVQEIYAKVPVLPRSLLVPQNTPKSTSKLGDAIFDVEYLCRKALIARFLTHHFRSGTSYGLTLNTANQLSWAMVQIMDTSVSQWSRTSNATHSAKFQVMLELSKSIQYFHSVGVVVSKSMPLYYVLLDSKFRPKIQISYLKIKRMEPDEYTYEKSVFAFGRLFYEMYFNVQLSYSDRYDLKRDTIVKCPFEPEIRDDAWQLIQRCCAEDPESRPTMDEVVQEMESWGIESTPASPSSVNYKF